MMMIDISLVKKTDCLTKNDYFSDGGYEKVTNKLNH